jgi:hypothetical protein
MSSLKNGNTPQLLATEYASYRDGVTNFLSSQLAKAGRSRSHPLTLYDPLAGTAPLLPAAEHHGCTAYFNDLNSLHLYVNAAKTFKSYQTFKEISPEKLLTIVCKLASKLDHCPRTPTEDWIEDSVVEVLKRAWEKAEDQMGPIATLIRAILLLSIRNFSSFIKTTNPTWLKPGGLRQKISAEQAFRSTIDQLHSYYQHVYANYPFIKGGQIILTDYDATQLTPNNKVDVVMTSPPFCNRVDWDRMYAPEHFFLESVNVWHTRTEFLGTTSVRRYPDFDIDLNFIINRSSYLSRFLMEVQERQIRKERESDYYVKYFTRYFANLFRAFDKAVGVLSDDNIGIYFVVQDNSHRGLFIQIGKALAESLSIQGFKCIRKKSWDRHHLGLQNISKHYRIINPRQRETIWKAHQ